MTIGKYISKLLQKHDSVVFPGFGTFTTRYYPAKFIQEEKIVKAPAKLAHFDAEPKNGDTTLTLFIADAEGKRHEEVIEFCHNWVRETDQVLDAGGKIELDKIGLFFKDTTGSLMFEPDESINYLAIDSGLPEISTPEQKPVDTVSEDKTKHPPQVTPIKRPEAKSKESQPYSPDIPKQKTHEAMTDPKKEERNKAAALPPALKWTAIIIIPLLVILIILFLNYNFFFGDDGLFVSRDPVVVEAPTDMLPVEPVEEPFEEIIEEEFLTPEPGPEPEPALTYDPYAEPPKADPYRPVYYVIVGSFENVNNASQLALKLRKEGHQLASVLDVIPRGFHRTYSGYYYDLNEAQASKQNLREGLREIAWILHR